MNDKSSKKMTSFNWSEKTAFLGHSDEASQDCCLLAGWEQWEEPVLHAGHHACFCFSYGPGPASPTLRGPCWPPGDGKWLGKGTLGVRRHAQDPVLVFQCPPCRSLTRVLVESYRKIKEAGQKFEIIFVSADR